MKSSATGLSVRSFKVVIPIGLPTFGMSTRKALISAFSPDSFKTVIAAASQTATQAFNVTAKIAGRDPGLPPLVIMTPRSGWWQCASERGGGLACWLETMRVLAIAKPERNCFFVACSGHELGFLGIDAFLERRPDLIKRAHQWIHFGANIGACGQTHLVHASDDIAERWAVAAMELQGLTEGATAARGSSPRGEAGALHRGGGRYVTLVCGTDVFHHAADRWPDAVDVALLGRYARAFANGALQLASQASQPDESPMTPT